MGESVTVTLSASFQVPTCTHLTERVWHDLTLGACFSRVDGEEVVSKVGLCEPGGVPLPDSIALSNDTSHIHRTYARKTIGMEVFLSCCLM